MIASCIDTDFSSCSKNLRLMEFLRIDLTAGPAAHSSLNIGGEYLVVAFGLGPFCPWLFVADRFPGIRYPLICPANLFEIKDSRRSKFWDWGHWIDRMDNTHPILAPRPWAADPVYHSYLFEGSQSHLADYEEALSLLEMEYPLPWILEKAKSIGFENWVTDENFSDHWEADPEFAMTLNPATRRLMHNPHYRSAADGRSV
jgi:hypothetical protein